MVRAKIVLGFVLFLLTCSAGVLAFPPAPEGPLTKDQVLSLVRNQLADATGARAIRERGIDFEPTEDFLGALKSVGASDAFIEALKAAPHPATGQPAAQPQTPATPPAAPPPGVPPAAPTALDLIQVLDLMINEVPSPRMAALVKERGITFEAQAGILILLQSMGAHDDLVKALRSARVISQGWEQDRAAEKTHAQLAEGDYEQKLQSEPTNHFVRLALALARQTLGKKAGEVELFREGVRLEPNDPWSHGMLGGALNDADNHEGAAQEYRTAIRLQPSFFFAHFGLAVLLESEKNWKAAVAEYREVGRLRPDWAEPHLNSGRILTMYLKDHEGAIHELQQAARLDPKSDDAFWYLGEEFMYYTHSPGEAIAPFRTACQLKPDNYLYHYSLGEALVQKGDKAAGWEEYRKAHELKPDDQDIRTKFEALSKELGK